MAQQIPIEILNQLKKYKRHSKNKSCINCGYVGPMGVKEIGFPIDIFTTLFTTGILLGIFYFIIYDTSLGDELTLYVLSKGYTNLQPTVIIGLILVGLPVRSVIHRLLEQRFRTWCPKCGKHVM